MTINLKFYNTIARFYDAENKNMTDDLALYSALATETGGPVLDVGCGTGRVMLHLAQAGMRVIGLDHSEAMVTRGQRKLAMMPDLHPLATFMLGDVLETDLSECFKLIIVSYNGFMHFNEQADQLAALRRFHHLLLPGGQLVLDVPNAGEAFATQDDDALTFERLFVEPESEHLVMQQSISTLDRATQQLHVTWVYDEIAEDNTVRRTLAPWVLRYVFPGEMHLLLAAAGFQHTQFYGGYQREPFIDGSPYMITLAHKGPEVET